MMAQPQQQAAATETTTGAMELRRLMTLPIGETINDRAGFALHVAPYIEDILPGGVTAERVHAITRLVVKQNFKLQECTGGSVWRAVLEILSAGLTPDKVLGEAYIVPFKGEATPIVGYRGYRTLAYNHPKVCKVEAKVVRVGDEFDVVYGTEQRLFHKPCGNTGTKDEDFEGAWALAVLQDGATLIQWCPKGEILEHRQASASFRFKPNDSPWTTNPEPMWAKTAFRILVPYLPQSRQLALAAAIDQRDEDMASGKGSYAITESDHALERALEAADEPASGTARAKKALAKKAKAEPEPPATEPEAPSPPPEPEPPPKVPKAATAEAIAGDREAQELFDRLSAKGNSDEVEQAKQDVREAHVAAHNANVKDSLITKVKRGTVGDGPWMQCRDAAVLSEFARQVAALVPPTKEAE